MVLNKALGVVDSEFRTNRLAFANIGSQRRNLVALARHALVVLLNIVGQAKLAVTKRNVNPINVNPFVLADLLSRTLTSCPVHYLSCVAGFPQVSI